MAKNAGAGSGRTPFSGGLPGKNNQQRPARSRTESAGVADGLSERSDCAVLDGVTKDVGFSDKSSAAAGGGYSREALGKRTSQSVKDKGNTFELC